MNKAAIIESIYKDKAYKQVCRNIATLELYEDLFHETILTLLELTDEKIIEAYQKKYLKFLFVKIAHNAWNSNTSPFCKKYRQHEITSDITELRGLAINIDLELETKEEIYQDFTQIIKDQISALEWYDQTLLLLYIDAGEFMKVSKMTSIKYGAVQYTLQKIIKKIKLQNEHEFKTFIDNYHS